MILGISLDENFAYVNVLGNDEVTEIPFALGRNLVNNSWFIGEDARVENIDNTDIVIDKLYYLLENDGNAKIGNKNYDAKELTEIFMNTLILKYQEIEYLAVVVRNNNIKVLSKLEAALSNIFKNEKKFKVTTFSEAFISYIKSKPKEYYDNPIALINFTEKALTYYELVRYKGDNDLEYWKVNTKEHLSLPLDLLSGDTGKKLCDNLLYDFVKNSIKEDVYNNIILSGLGFNEASSYREFMTYVCSITRVDTDINFFAKAAAFLSNDFLTDNFDKNVVLMSDARTTVSISIYAKVNKKDTKLEIIKPGMEWFSIFNYSFNVIIEDTRAIKFEYLKVIEGVINDFTINIPDNYKLRSDKSNQFEISLTFIQQNVMDILVADIGFGEFYEASHERILKDNIYL